MSHEIFLQSSRGLFRANLLITLPLTFLITTFLNIFHLDLILNLNFIIDLLFLFLVLILIQILIILYLLLYDLFLQLFHIITAKFPSNIYFIWIVLILTLVPKIVRTLEYSIVIDSLLVNDATVDTFCGLRHFFWSKCTVVLRAF